MDALSEKSLTKSPGEGTLFPWDYSCYRQKQKFASPYYVCVSVLRGVAYCLRVEEQISVPLILSLLLLSLTSMEEDSPLQTWAFSTRCPCWCKEIWTLTTEPGLRKNNFRIACQYSNNQLAGMNWKFSHSIPQAFTDSFSLTFIHCKDALTTHTERN